MTTYAIPANAVMDPICSNNGEAGHCPHWYDSGETCHYCGTAGSCPHTVDVGYDGRWCGICNPWLGGDSFDQRS
jgi:hypothetical protein